MLLSRQGCLPSYKVLSLLASAVSGVGKGTTQTESKKNWTIHTGLGTFKQLSDDARSRLKAFLQTLAPESS